MLLDFGDIMRHVVDQMHVQVVGCRVEYLGERLSRQKRHAASIDPRVIGRRAHALQVVLALGRVDARTRQLTIVRFDVVAFHRFLHGDQAVCCHLMAQTTAPAVNHDAYLTFKVDSFFVFVFVF